MYLQFANKCLNGNKADEVVCTHIISSSMQNLAKQNIVVHLLALTGQGHQLFAG